MALSEPYPLPFLSDILPVSKCQFELARFEETSGSGSGQFWAAEMADPLWRVSISLSPCLWPLAREINAKVTALGAMKTMHFADPTYSPAAGRSAGTGIVIGAINSTRDAIALTGLPASYRVTAGDRLSIARAGVSHYFGEFAETVAANTSGATVQIAVSPPLPLSFAVGATVVLDSPIIRLRVPPGEFSPYSEMLGGFSSGASLNTEQKR